MKVVILAGGLGTRLAEETGLRPKPMVEIGGMPILWHIMKTYSHYGYNEFIIALGYKGSYIKERFADYHLNNSDVTFDLKNNSIEIHKNNSENWKVTLVDTGLETQTGGRIKKIIEKGYIDDDEFMLTYGDGVSNIDISRLVDEHNKNNGLVTLSAVMPQNRFGKLELDGNRITEFGEKKDNIGTYINGGYMVINKKIINYISDYLTPFEKKPLEQLSNEGLLYSYRHDGFWFAMDTLNEKKQLEKMRTSNTAPWKIR